MTWTALLPIKPAGMRKTRLATRLTVTERDALAERLLARALAALAGEPRIGRVVILSPRPHGHDAEWIMDAAPTLNEALAAAAGELGRPLLVMLPDLPWVTSADIAALLDAARPGAPVLAADRHGRGTNALAIADDAPVAFRFGADSLAAFRSDRPGGTVLRREGLAFDCDEPADLDLLEAAAPRGA